MGICLTDGNGKNQRARIEHSCFAAVDMQRNIRRLAHQEQLFIVRVQPLGVAPKPGMLQDGKLSCPIADRRRKLSPGPF